MIRLEAQDLEEDAQAGQAQGAQGPVQHQLAAVVGVELHVEGDQGQSYVPDRPKGKDDLAKDLLAGVGQGIVHWRVPASHHQQLPNAGVQVEESSQELSDQPVRVDGCKHDNDHEVHLEHLQLVDGVEGPQQALVQRPKEVVQCLSPLGVAVTTNVALTYSATPSLWSFAGEVVSAAVVMSAAPVLVRVCPVHVPLAAVAYRAQDGFLAGVLVLNIWCCEGVAPPDVGQAHDASIQKKDECH
mmetsp:Transcript_123734/g.293920  ORF Transcript_123734/g.293920 Transcript_123734/m.293920 type:complete len:242 (-) Transcript_123734:1821-2546(-)